MHTPPLSIAMFMVAAMLGALGQYLYKSGADAAGSSVASYLFNPRLLGGVLCYLLVMILFVAGFKRGGAMTVLYPIYASTFIWGAVIGLIAYGTPIKLVNLAGMLLLVVGIHLMGR